MVKILVAAQRSHCFVTTYMFIKKVCIECRNYYLLLKLIMYIHLNADRNKHGKVKEAEQDCFLIMNTAYYKLASSL